MPTKTQSYGGSVLGQGNCTLRYCLHMTNVTAVSIAIAFWMAMSAPKHPGIALFVIVIPIVGLNGIWSPCIRPHQCSFNPRYDRGVHSPRPRQGSSGSTFGPHHSFDKPLCRPVKAVCDSSTDLHSFFLSILAKERPLDTVIPVTTKLLSLGDAISKLLPGLY